LAAYTERTFGGVDIVVNNAGVMLDPPGSRAQDVKRDVLVATFEVKVYGAIGLCHAFVPGMLRRRFGRIVNVSSGMAQLSAMHTS
jgi:NAD(P)-dependent dehydrogenase (short-subunit alcohol dehydrogenase family)